MSNYKFKFKMIEMEAQPMLNAEQRTTTYPV